MAENNELEKDTFVELSLTTENALNDAIPELAWISAGGGDPPPSEADRVIAEDKEGEYKDRRSQVRERLLAYLSKKLTVPPPSETDLKKAIKIAVEIADFKNKSVQATTVIHAVTEILNVYAKS
jgi:hypothetical protein